MPSIDQQGPHDPAPARTPHTAVEAIAWARAAVDGPREWRRRCLNFVARAYGYRYSGTVYALDHYRVVMRASMRHDGDRNPPSGALLFWDTDSRAGHFALYTLYLGGGLVTSSDILTPPARSALCRPATSSVANGSRTAPALDRRA